MSANNKGYSVRARGRAINIEPCVAMLSLYYIQPEKLFAAMQMTASSSPLIFFIFFFSVAERHFLCNCFSYFFLFKNIVWAALIFRCTRLRPQFTPYGQLKLSLLFKQLRLSCEEVMSNALRPCLKIRIILTFCWLVFLWALDIPRATTHNPPRPPAQDTVLARSPVQCLVLLMEEGLHLCDWTLVCLARQCYSISLFCYSQCHPSRPIPQTRGT